MRPNRLMVMVVALAPMAACAQDAYRIEPTKDAPPGGLAAAIREALQAEGHRVVNPEGKPFAALWLRKGVPAAGPPAGPKGAVLFPVLAEGELLGVLRFDQEGQDYRNQAIPAGLYTLRYALQPVNGDHLGVSTYRDYALLSPAARDQAVAAVPRKTLEERSAAAAGSSHPAVLLMLAAPSGAPSGPTIVHDETLNTWGAILSLPLTVTGTPGATSLPIQLVVSGAKTD